MVPKSLEKVTCEVCGIMIVKKVFLRHFKEKHVSDPPQFKCELCNFTSKRELQLKDHQRRLHLEPTILLSRKNKQ